MYGKLQDDWQENIEIEDISQRTLSRKFLNRLKSSLSAKMWDNYMWKPTLAREMHKKQTDINIPVIVTW